jgi:O-antigen biosynthesis protein
MLSGQPSMIEFVKSRYRSIRAWFLTLDLHSSGNFSLSPDEQKTSSEISVIVAVHNAPKVTRRCLDSLQKFAGNAEIIIVDDASSLGEVKQMTEDFCRRNNWGLMRNDKALGHSRASEMGISVSKKPYVCLLNSDAIVSSKSWNGAVQAFESSQQIAIVGPSTSYTVGSQVVRRACHCRHYWSDKQIWCFAEKYFARQKNPLLVDVPFVGGFAFFVRRSVWDTLGGFDKNLPDYGNEMEFCQRVKRAGLRIVWTKSSYIHHLGNESYGKAIGLEAIKKRSLQALAYSQKKHGE